MTIYFLAVVVCRSVLRSDMRSASLWAATATLLCGSAFALEPGEIFQMTRASVVAITATDTRQGTRIQGSGVLVGAGDVVTNCHLVRQAVELEVRQGNEKRGAVLRYQDLERNLCQLSLQSPLTEARPVTDFIASTHIDVGQLMYAVTVPYGDEHTFLRGMVAGLMNRQGETARLLRIDVGVAPGSSGGGLFDDKGRLAGIVTAGLTDAQNLNIVLPSEWILEIPKRNLDRVAAGVNPDGARAEPAAKPQSAVTVNTDLTDIRAGAQWKYRMFTQGKSVGTVTFDVTRVSGERVRERITREGFNAYRFDREVGINERLEGFHPLIRLPGGYQLPEVVPYYPKQKGPKVGESWPELSGEYYIPRAGTRQLKSKVFVKKQEHISVPAGAFDTWLFEVTAEPVFWQSSPHVVKCRYWYAEKASRPVKMEIEILAGYTIGNTKETYELVSYSLGK